MLSFIEIARLISIISYLKYEVLSLRVTTSLIVAVPSDRIDISRQRVRIKMSRCKRFTSSIEIDLFKGRRILRGSGVAWDLPRELHISGNVMISVSCVVLHQVKTMSLR